MREAISDEGGNQWQSEHDSYLRTQTQSKCTRTQLKNKSDAIRRNQTQSDAIRRNQSAHVEPTLPATR